MAEINGCMSEWESNYVPQVVNAMLRSNDFMDEKLIVCCFQ